MNLGKLEKKLGYSFKDKELLKQALTHKSFSNENGALNNERLEFLGDAILDLAVSEYLFKNSSDSEGDMTKKRAMIVCEAALFTYALRLDLPDFIFVGQGEEEIQKSIIADTFEAIIAAIYLETDIYKIKELITKLIIPYIDEVKGVKDYKSTLQEHVQADKRNLKYETVEESGPPHAREFKVLVKMDEIIMGEGKGKRKQDAEQKAARMALEKLAKK